MTSSTGCEKRHGGTRMTRLERSLNRIHLPLLKSAVRADTFLDRLSDHKTILKCRVDLVSWVALPDTIRHYFPGGSSYGPDPRDSYDIF